MSIQEDIVSGSRIRKKVMKSCFTHGMPIVERCGLQRNTADHVPFRV